MAIPKYYEMYKPFLELLRDGQPHTLRDIRNHVSNYFCLSKDEITELLPSGRQKVFYNRIGWASTYLKHAKLIESPARATFIISKEGVKTLQEHPETIDDNYLMKFEAFINFKKNLSLDASINNKKEVDFETPDDAFEEAFEKINRSLADDLLSEIMKLSPIAFEQMVIDLMSKMGYGTFENASKTTNITGDEGIDGIIMEDKLGFNLIYIQAKHWNEDHIVGRPEIQAFVGAIAGKGGKGLFVTTSKFSKTAIDYAKNQHIILMDGSKLTKFMIDHNFGVSVKKVFEIKAIDTDIFIDYQNNQEDI